MERLKGKVAIVTGAAQGMGFAIARLFLSEGASVSAVDVNGDGLAQAVAALRHDQHKLISWTLDISDLSAVRRSVKQTHETFGRIDVLVNNAAIQAPGGTFVDATEADWDRYLAVNVKGAGFFAKEVIPYMQAQGGGSIVNIGSISGFVVFPGQAVYAATKGAILQLTRAIAVDFGEYGIRANCICPGPTRSGPLSRRESDADPGLLALANQHPLRRIAEPEDIAYAALFLACDESRHITGIALPVDGGFTAR
jgi:NAD(P)-dependent dehydrogenase (short-subunit alcohol dehydrogenase family)